MTRDPKLVAPLAGLTFLPPEPPGWGRRPWGRGFTFFDERGETIRGAERDRLVDLAVPPAWGDVWFAPLADGYLQATGVDDAGRKQYRYHDDYRTLCEARKFDRLRYFGRALPALRSFIAEALDAQPGSRELAIGAVLGVIDTGLLRVGNDRSSEEGRYGATTLLSDHLHDDGHVSISYRGKGGKTREVVIEDEQLSDVLGSLATTESDRLFSYVDRDGVDRVVTAADVNAVIAEVAGPAFSAKDFRTWGGSREALEARIDPGRSSHPIDAAAQALGNTRAVARASYVHPSVTSWPEEEIRAVWASSRRSRWMTRADRTLVKLLRR